MNYSITYHGQQTLTISGVAFQCCISRTIYGTLDNASTIGKSMLAWFDGLPSVDVLDSDTGEVILTIQAEEE